MDDGLFLHGSIVAATVGIDDGTALHFQISLQQLGLGEACFTFSGHSRCNGGDAGFFIAFFSIYIVCGLPIRRYAIIEVVTIATRKELTDINLCRRLHVTG